MISTGDCFVVLPPNTFEDAVILGRNSVDKNSLNIAQEIIFYEADHALNGESDGGAHAEVEGAKCAVILQKPKPATWGGDFGANAKNVSICISYEFDEELNNNYLTGSDIVRIALSVSSTADEAIEIIGSLITKYGGDNVKISLVICDPNVAWSFNSAGRLWAAQCFKTGFHSFPSTCLNVGANIDKCSGELPENLKSLGYWNGEDKPNFSACFGFKENTSLIWPVEKPSGDGNFVVNNMFEVLRHAATDDSSRSASVSVLLKNGISSHWFTGTPNAKESVFKPFVFAPNPKMSPLTKVLNDNTITLLYKLHAQRKPNSIENLKALEYDCVQEVNKYLSGHPIASEELDELMKDCVEAEVKFYR